jgi:AcrR family transcriptional regulator
MSPATRAYHSAIRDEQAQATRDRILAAALGLMHVGEETTMDQIARASGLERRTVFRHFATRDALLTAAFQWLNDRIGSDVAPVDPAGMAAAIRSAFARMDAHDGPIRAALHSQAGRDMRALTLPARRAAFAASLAPATRHLAPAKRARIEALAHLLYSASAWEVLKDYGGLTGLEAGEAAAWALEVLLSAASGAAPAADTTKD